MCLAGNCKNGISSYELHSCFGVTQKTAWFVLQRIRLAMQEGTISIEHVPTDETPSVLRLAAYKDRWTGVGHAGLKRPLCKVSWSGQRQ
jgi:hypothetical protein